MTPVRRSLLLLLLACALPLATVAQNDTSGSSNAAVGTLVYFEGSVEVKGGGTWSSATIEQSLRRGQSLRTGPTASAEIKWQNGTTSTIGPQTTQKVGPLYDKIASAASGDGGGVVDDFVELFEGESSSSSDVGGIRRASVETDTPGPGELYWKTFEEVSFADAQTLFQDENYAKAARTFHLFLQQHPGHTKAPKAKLGMGLCYLKLNNPTQARSAFEALVADHPDDPLADRARKMLDRL